MRRKNSLSPTSPRHINNTSSSSSPLPRLNFKAKSVSALLCSPPRIHPELSIESACRLFGLFVTTEIDELRAFKITLRAYEALPEALRETRHAKPVVSSVAFREMLIPDLSDSARERRSASARSIALKSSPRHDAGDTLVDDDEFDDGEFDDDAASVQSDSAASTISTHSAASLAVAAVRRRRAERRASLGHLMAPCHEIAMLVRLSTIIMLTDLHALFD